MPFRNRAAALSTSFRASLASASSRGPAVDFFAAVVRELAVLGAGFLAVFFFFVVAMKLPYLQAVGLPRGSAEVIMACSMEALIDLLQKNALTPREDIARMLDMTVEQVEAEVSRLEREGVILGYQTIINREKWDTDIVTAVIEVKITPERGGGFDRIASRIAKFEEVQTCYLMSGGYDLLIIVEAKNLRGVAAFVAEKLSTIEAVQATATHFRLKTYKENGAFHHFDHAPERLAVSP
jgi:DNA-binding Lrp family transcriptional regulator